jgi:hypothetical protein
MGMQGFDGYSYGKWARSQMSPMTLIHGGKKQKTTFITLWKLVV